MTYAHVTQNKMYTENKNDYDYANTDIITIKLTRESYNQTKPNVASVINNLILPFVFSSNLWCKLIALCVANATVKTCLLL